MGQEEIYRAVTEKIIAELEKGVIPWRKPWTVTNPKNAKTGNAYRGMNRLVLGMSGYGCPHWATYRQVQEMGGQVRKGEKSTGIIYWQWIKKEEEQADGTPREITFPYIRSYRVFNLEQTTVKFEKPKKVRKNIRKAQKIVDEMPNKPNISIGGNVASYTMMLDKVRVPNPELFDSNDMYYSTFFHELGHSTRHPSRLNRGETKAHPGSDAYSQEELVAELSAAFLCGFCSIENNRTLEDSASYIQHWLRALKSDRRMLVIAAAQAEKAAEYILAGQAKKVKKTTVKKITVKKITPVSNQAA